MKIASISNQQIFQRDNAAVLRSLNDKLNWDECRKLKQKTFWKSLTWSCFPVLKTHLNEQFDLLFGYFRQLFHRI